MIFRFDGENLAAQRAAERAAAAMVTGISEETRAALRALVVRAIHEGIPPYDAARIIVSMIGLTEQQSQAAMNYRESLINEGLSLDRINVLVDRYSAKLLRQRSVTIARTEIMGALNRGALEAYGQAQQKGLLSGDAVKEWITTPDERLCPVCAPLDGKQVPLKAMFETANGPLPGPVAHPRCRCALAVTEPI